MIFDGRWKYIRCETFRPVLFDLKTDPLEVTDLGASPSPEHQEVRRRMESAVLDWATRHHTRITATPRVLEGQKIAAEEGILIGFWDEAEFESVTGMSFDSLTPARKTRLQAPATPTRIVPSPPSCRWRTSASLLFRMARWFKEPFSVTSPRSKLGAWGRTKIRLIRLADPVASLAAVPGVLSVHRSGHPLPSCPRDRTTTPTRQALLRLRR